jgi:hypothetical protein
MTSRAYRRSQLWAATANFTSIMLDAALLYGTRFLLLLCNGRHAQQFYWTDFLFGDRQVFVCNFSFEITAARLNLLREACTSPTGRRLQTVVLLRWRRFRFRVVGAGRTIEPAPF